MKTHFFIVAALAGAAATLATHAQTLAPLVVEAWQDSVLPGHFAGNATVIDRETITRSGAHSIADLLATEAGIRFSGTSGNRSAAVAQLRGFGENAASRTLVMIDGRPINRPDMGAASWFSVPLARLERVEVLRGPHTARFGDQAVGGVINLVTRRGGPPATAVETAGGSDGQFLARLNHRNSIGSHAVAFDFEHDTTDGWRENAFHDHTSTSLRWNAQPNAHLQADLGITYAEESAGFPGPLGLHDYLRNPRDSIYARFGQADQYFSESTRWTADARLRLDLTDTASVEIPATFLRRDLGWNLGPGFHADTRLDTFTLTPRLTLTSDEGSLEAGFAYRHDSLEVNRFAEIQRRNRTAAATLQRDTLGFFTDVEWHPASGWTLRTAARLECSQNAASARSHVFPANPDLNFHRDTAETNHALQLGVTWHPGPDHSAWLRYDRLYRLPSTDEIASYQGFPLSEPFNDRLRAETGHNLELGGEWTPGAWTLRLNAFVQWLDGEILYDFNRNLNLNLADTRRLGIETLISYRGEDWDASLRHTSLTAEFRDGPYAGEDVYLVPNHELTAILAIRPTDRLSLQAEYQWIDSSHEGNDFLNQRPKLPAYGVANLLVRYEPKPGLSLYARINNLLDARYATVKYSGVWYPAAGRQFLLGLRHEF